MNDEAKLQLKFELELKLKSPEDVQQWAMQTLENDPSNLIALDLCFFNNVQDVYRYFKNLELRDFDSDMVNRAVYKTLYQFLDDQSEYIINKNQIDAFVKDT